MFTNYELKHKALAALKGNWQTALMVALIAALPSLISQVVSILTGTGYMEVMTSLMLAMQQNPTADLEALIQLAGVNVGAMGYSAILTVVTGLISPFLMLGLINYMLDLLRGVKDAPITAVFSRRGCFFKAIGLNIMVYLRVLVWMLPGMALTMAAVFVPVDWLASLLLSGGMIAMMVLGIRAAMHYALATHFMADNPGTGVNEAIRLSYAMLRRRKLLLFILEMSFIGWNLLLMILQTVVGSMFGAVIASTVYMVLNLVLTVYMQASICAFYDAYLHVKAPEATPDPDLT